MVISNNNNNNDNKKIQRVLILQGGGALGAYEAGIYKALYEHLIDQSLNQNRQLFDIVAGTSTGAINASIIVNHVTQNKDKRNPQEVSVDNLCQFWEDVSIETKCYITHLYSHGRMQPTPLGKALMTFGQTHWHFLMKIIEHYH